MEANNNIFQKDGNRLDKSPNERKNDGFSMKTWQEFYKANGLRTIPLRPREKVPMFKGWQKRSASDLWLNAPDDANLGILGDGVLVQIDCDDYETSGILWKHQEGLGIKICGVLTKRGDRFYLRVTDLPDFKILKMRDPFSGELINKWQGVAAPSVVDGWQYRLFGDLSTIPVVERRDLTWLLPELEIPKDVTSDTRIPVKLLKRPAPSAINEMLYWLKNAIKGQTLIVIDRIYHSRSEVLQSVIWSLILNGWTFNAISKVMPGYKGNYWLEQNYKRAIVKLSAFNKRPELLELYQQPPEFEGRTRGTDARIFQAVVALAWRAGKYTVHASIRDVAMLTDVGRQTAHRAMQRMCREGVLLNVKKGKDGNANLYRILINGQSGTCNTGGIVRNALVCESALEELWQPSCLGTTAGNLYGHLNIEPKKAKKFAILLKCHRRTAKRNLMKLEREGLAIHTKAGWIKGKASIKEVGERWDVIGRAEKRRNQFEQERRSYHKLLKGEA